MPLPSIRFKPPYDVHLLRGQSFQIISEGLTQPNGAPFADLLSIGNQHPSTYVDNNPNHRYQFRFSFDDSKAADFGIRISNPITNARKPDCVITLDANEPALLKNRIRNFYVFAEIIDTGGTTSPDDDSKNETALRIHIHNTIEEIWMTPNPLTIYQGLYYRAQLYARFDDNCIAKIGRSTFRGNRGFGFVYNINPAVEVNWSSATSGLIDAQSETIRPEGLSGTHTISAAVTYNGTSYPETTGTVVISEQLTQTTTRRAELVATGFSLGFSKLNTIPNVLFISDGFTTEQELEFKSFVVDYVYDLVSNKITSPFTLLKGAINFWMVFIPSRESGITVFGERIVIETTNSIGLPQLVGMPVPFIENPENLSISKWSIRHLLYFTGLPARSEKNTTAENLAEKWKSTTNLSDGQVDALINSRTDLIDEWKTCAERRLPEIPDTALGLVVNDYTAACKDDEYNMINLDSKRTHRDYLDDFFAGLKNTDGNLIGTAFIKSPNNMTDPTGLQGKDWDNIIIITASKQGRAQNEDGYMFSTIGSQDVDELTGDLTQNRVSIEPVTLPFKLPPSVKGTITHEICHSFGLGDEYGESLPSNFYRKKPVTNSDVSSWDFAQYTGDGASLDTYSNVQAKADLEVPGSDGTRRIQAFRIKWRYHRTRKCGLVSAVSINQQLLTLTLQPGQAKQFAQGNTVFLRKRKKDQFSYFVSDPTATAPVSIGMILSPDPVPPAFLNDVDVLSVNAASNQITIQREISSGTFRTRELILENGKAALLQPGQKVRITREYRPGPIYTVFRTDSGAIEQKALSTLLTITSVHTDTHQLEMSIPADFPDFLKILTSNDAMIVYQPIDMPPNQHSANYPHAEVIAQKVLLELLAKPSPFNADKDNREIIDPTTDTRIPGHLIPCCSKRKREIIGLYAGGARYHGGIYHPAAQCMMRHHTNKNRYVELCAVCRYTLINLIDPTKFAEFDADYMKRKIYPD